MVLVVVMMMVVAIVLMLLPLFQLFARLTEKSSSLPVWAVV